MIQTSDNLLNQLRALAASQLPYTFEDANAFATLFEWMDDRIMAGQFPTDYVIAFRRHVIGNAIAESEKEVVPDAEVVG